jgi:ATP-dependent DNA helicase 2 subunit 1
LLPTDIKYAFSFGNEKIVFTKDEVNSIRKAASEPKLELLGFKPSNMLKFQQNLKHSCFIYPNDKEIIGSSAVFANLLEGMIRMDKIAICSLVARKDTASQIVALIPDVSDFFLTYHVEY